MNELLPERDPWHLAENSKVSFTVISPKWTSFWLIYADVFCVTNSFSLCPLYVIFPLTCYNSRYFHYYDLYIHTYILIIREIGTETSQTFNERSNLCAKASKRVVFPEDGGPSNKVILEGLMIPDISFNIVNFALLAKLMIPREANADSAMLRAAFGRVGRALCPIWHSTSTLKSSHLISTVGRRSGPELASLQYSTKRKSK